MLGMNVALITIFFFVVALCHKKTSKLDALFLMNRTTQQWQF